MAGARDSMFGRLAESSAQATADRVHREAAPEEPTTSTYSGFVTRTIAFAIDAAVIDLVAVVVGAVVALVFSILPVSHDLKTVAVAVGAAGFAVWAIAYFATFWTTTGETPGNRTMRIRVQRADGSPLRVRHALVRLAGMLLGLPLMLGYVPIVASDRRRGLHDVMAGTVVVDVPDAATPSRSRAERGRGVPGYSPKRLP